MAEMFFLGGKGWGGMECDIFIDFPWYRRVSLAFRGSFGVQGCAYLGGLAGML